MTNKFGDVFTNLAVAQILGDGLVLKNASGEMKVKYENLPLAIRKKYQPLAAGVVEKEQSQGALTAAYVAHLEKLRDEQSQQRATREANENAQANSQSDGSGTGQIVQSVIIKVPNQDWNITIMNPGLNALDRHVNGDELVERGIPGTNGCNLSLFVEMPANDGASNDDVFNYYWARAAQDPRIEQDSVKIERRKKFVIVAYTVQGVPNANYYFAYGGRWVGVHIWKWPFDAAADGRLFTEFEDHLSYGE
ncbi:MAG: hypothetical protein ACREDS_10170 [Limisphaerales bacterium]